MDATSPAGRETPDFFIAGGTIPLGSESYIPRAADQQILDSLLAGRFCYVLNSRQMGKSSLCVRTMARLGEQGIRCAFIDITKLGGRNVTPEQWYAGMALEIGRSLGLRTEILEYWKAESSVGPMQRFFGALQQVVLKSSQDRIVVFIDEIDSTRSLPFDTDEFFAGVRECFNRRVQEPDFERLTFCFLGVAVPSDLIKDARTTPFNIGDRIALRDFTLDEVRPLARSLGRHGEVVIERVHHWTNGHPFLTQSICRALMQHTDPIRADVDALVSRDLLEPKARETNINLSDVGNRVLNGFADGDDVDAFRADILSAYQRALTGKEPVLDDESNRVSAVLKLSGLMKVADGHLVVRNRIYEQVFGKKWIVENMPGQELRRQRLAYRRGAFRIGLGAAAVIAVIGFLAYSNYTLRVKAEKTAREMAWRAYVADMNRLPVLFEQNNTALMEDILARHEKEPWRGVEWEYWDGRISDAVWVGPKEKGRSIVSAFPMFDRVLVTVGDKASVLDAASGKVLDRFAFPKLGYSDTNVLWDGDTVIRSRDTIGGGYTYSIAKKRIIKRIPPGLEILAWRDNVSRDLTLAVGHTYSRSGIVDLSTMSFVHSWPRSYWNFFFGFFPDGTLGYMRQEGESLIGEWIDIVSGRVRSRSRPFVKGWIPGRPNEHFLTVSFTDGWLRRFDRKTWSLMWEIKLTDKALDGYIVSESSDGRYVAIGSQHLSGFLVKVENGRPRLVRTFADAARMQISPRGDLVLVSSSYLRAFATGSSSEGLEVQVPDFLGTMVALDDGSFVSTSTDKLYVTRVTPAGLQVASTNIGSSEVRAMRALDGGRLRGLSDGPKGMRLVDFENSNTLFTFSDPIEMPFLHSIDENKVLVTNNLREYRLVDLSRGEVAHAFKLSQDSRCIAISPNHQLFAVGCQDGSVLAFSLGSFKRLWEKRDLADGVTSVRFSRDSKSLIATCADGTASLLKAMSGQQTSMLVGHAQQISSADFLPAGNRAVTVSIDRTIRVWDVGTGTELTTLGEAGNQPFFCRVTKDGKFVVTGDLTGLIKAWRLKR